MRRQGMRRQGMRRQGSELGFGERYFRLLLIGPEREKGPGSEDHVRWGKEQNMKLGKMQRRKGSEEDGHQVA